VFANSDSARIAFHNRVPGAVPHVSNIRWCAVLDIIRVITEDFGAVFDFLIQEKPTYAISSMSSAYDFLVGDDGPSNRADVLRQGLHVMHCLTPFYNAIYFNEGDDCGVITQTFDNFTKAYELAKATCVNSLKSPLRTRRTPFARCMAEHNV
jgi:hypothetical protein